MSDLCFFDASFTLCENIFPDAWPIQRFHEFETFTAHEIYHLMKNGLITKDVCVQDMFKKWHSMESDTLMVRKLNGIHLIVKNKEHEMKMKHKKEEESVNAAQDSYKKSPSKNG